MHAKLGFVAALIAYQFVVQRVHRGLGTAVLKWSAVQLRLFAQGPAVLLFTLVVLVIMRDRLGWVWGSLGLLVAGGVVALAVASRRARRADEAHA